MLPYRHNLNLRLLPVTLVLLLAVASGSFARNADIDSKPFTGGMVTARTDGMITWSDAGGNALDSVRLKIDIAGIDVRDDRVLAVSADGTVMSVERGGRSRRLCRSRISGGHDRVVGIASTLNNTLILTRGGVIMSTVDFDTFTTLDFNGTYYSYYQETLFCSISASDNSFCIAGTYPDGMPAVFTSATGKIWSERSLTYTQGGETYMLEQQPVRLSYDRSHDRFVMLCSDGWVFYMPGCSHCNSLEYTGN